LASPIDVYELETRSGGRQFIQLPISRLSCVGGVEGLALRTDAGSLAVESFFLPSSNGHQRWDSHVARLLAAFLCVAILVLVIIVVKILWPPLLVGLEGWLRKGGTTSESPPSSSGPTSQTSHGGQQMSLQPQKWENRIEELVKWMDAEFKMLREQIAQSRPVVSDSSSWTSGPASFASAPFNPEIDLKMIGESICQEIRDVVRMEMHARQQLVSGHLQLHAGDREFLRDALTTAVRSALSNGYRPGTKRLEESTPGEAQSTPAVGRPDRRVESLAIAKSIPKPSDIHPVEKLKKSAASFDGLTAWLGEVLYSRKNRIDAVDSFGYVSALAELRETLAKKAAEQGFGAWFARVSNAGIAQGWLLQEVSIESGPRPRFLSNQGLAIFADYAWQVMLAIAEAGTGPQPERVVILFPWSRLEKGAPAIARSLVQWPTSTLRPELVRCIRPALLEWSDQAAGYTMTKPMVVAPVERASGEINED
jgi:hypothetical protein